MSTSTNDERPKDVDHANSRLRIGSRDKTVAWYNPALSALTEAQRDLFENYSHLAPDRVIPHILEVVRTPPSPLSYSY